MADDFGIIEATEAYLKTLCDDDLLSLADELNAQHDRDCSWAWRMHISEEMWLRAESAAYSGDIRKVLEAMEWAQDVKGKEFVDEDGDPCNLSDFLEAARDNIDEIVSCVVGGIDFNGVPDVYMAIDTDELLEEIKKTSEWQEEYGEEWEDE